ncbi:MAG: hypothetical protein Q4E77_09280 [Conchiformibius sp.]|nr:hypothetical protein [Conchiformibius sp.]
MKTKLLILMAVSTLTACANTMQGAVKDGSTNLKTASEWVENNRDEIDAAAAKTGQLIKQGGNLIGRGMEKTGELIQEITR